MYKKLLRPILFHFKPEFIHNLSFYIIKILFKISFIKFLSKKFFVLNHKNLEIKIFGKVFKNRIGLAAGFDKNGDLLNEMEYFGFGHVEIGTITPLPQDGNPQPRLFRIPADNRDLNYAKYFTQGEESISEFSDYTSHNTEQLDQPELIDLLSYLEIIKEKVSA